MALPDHTLAMVLAGGAGTRLAPLTRDRAKPAVPFAGHFRIIDFVLSNLVNAGFRHIVVLTQYKSHSLDRHIARAWRMSAAMGDYVVPVPAQMRRGPRWFAGSADAIYQNLNIIHDERPEHVLVFGADHIYRMDPRQMLAHHRETGAEVTVAAMRVPRAQSTQFGVIEPEDGGTRISAFHEKPTAPPGLADAPDHVLASMGNYVFDTHTLVEAVIADANDEGSGHDLGGDLIPRLTAEGRAHVYDYAHNHVPGEPLEGVTYWRDVGTIDAYHAAHEDLYDADPAFDLHNHHWPIRTWIKPRAPAKLLPDPSGEPGRAEACLLSPGSVVHGADVRRSVLSPGVRVHPGAQVIDSVVMDRVEIGEGAVVRRAILDKDIRVPPGAGIGTDPDRDRERYVVSDGGVVVLGKGDKVHPDR